MVILQYHKPGKMGTTFQGWSFYSIVLNYSFFIDSGILNRFKSSHLKSKFPQNQKSTKFLLFGNFLCENVVRQKIYRKTLKICDYVKSVRIQSFFWTVFSSTRTQYGYLLSKSPYWVRTRENTNQRKLCTWALFTQSMKSVCFHREYRPKTDWKFAILFCEGQYQNIIGNCSAAILVAYNKDFL